MSLKTILVAIIGFLGTVVGLVTASLYREKGKREIAEKERDSIQQNQLDSLEVQRIKEEKQNVEIDNNDRRTGIGGKR